MEKKPYKKIPTWDAGTWTYTLFDTEDQFREFVKGLFKEPGKYNFDETAWMFNEHARRFEEKRMFCEAPEGSRDYLNYWDTEKEKCRVGVIFKNDKGGVWYLPRFYYHWINFLRIYRKAPPKGFHFPDVRDVQYHMALYEYLAELHGENSAMLKKRQIASSYFHIAKIYNRYIFEDGFVSKILASDKKYINSTGSWKFLEEYHNFTNAETAWVRHNQPDKEFNWQQKLETKTPDGRKIDIGTKATITGITLDKDPVAGVGGAVDEVFYEEGGIAPTALVTYGYMRNAMKEGGIITGHFVIAGSVGDLDQCEPLKEFVLNPEAYTMYKVWSDLIDDKGTEGYTGLFIPEQWGMPPYIDQYGNSMVKEALQYLDEFYEKQRKLLKEDDYQLLISQGPRNIAEAFAIRKVSPFPIKHTAAQIRRIEDKNYNLEYFELDRNEKDQVTLVPSRKEPMTYPTNRNATDKTGVVVIHERPVKNMDGTIPWLTYLASIDPVETGDTTTSDSLASIYVYKMPIEVTRTDAEGQVTQFIEGGKLVCEWVGRFDDPIKTNEQLCQIIELYNAYTICEKNKPGFISYMQLKRKQKYLAKASEMLFDKEHSNTDDTFKAYGYTMTTNLWSKLLQYGIDSLSEEVHTKIGDDGTIEKISYGVERIPFIWLLKEMQNYEKGKNFDRVIAYCALMAFVAKQMGTMGVRKKIERSTTTPTNTENLRNLLRGGQPFRNLGRDDRAIPSQYQIPRKAFKHLR